jgi:spore maturation protein CgeB
MYRPEPYVPGEHFVAAPLEDMARTVRYYLEHEGERADIASQGHSFVTNELDMTRSVRRILDAL